MCTTVVDLGLFSLQLKGDHESSQVDLQDSSPITLTVHTPSNGGERKGGGGGGGGGQSERLQGEEVCGEGEGKAADAHSEASDGEHVTRDSSQPSSSFLQDAGSQEEEADGVGETPSQPATPSQLSSSSIVLQAHQPGPTSPKEVIETDPVMDEPLCSSQELPVPSSCEARLSWGNISQNGAKGVEGTSTETEIEKRYCNSPTGKHSRSSLTSVLTTNGAGRVDTSSSFVPPSSPPSASLVSSPPSSAFSPLRRTSSSHRTPHAVNPVSLQSALHKHDITVAESRLRHRERPDHSPSRRLEPSPPLCAKVASGKSPKLAPILSEFKKTIDNADKFGRAMAAMAESGSSDQDSDSEPHFNLGLSGVPLHELAKVTEKMRAPQSSAIRQKVSIRKNSGEMSFGFSIADGQYDLGVYVKTIKPGGPSDRAGLLQYDKIIKVGTCLCMLCLLYKSGFRTGFLVRGVGGNGTPCPMGRTCRPL